MPKRGKGNRGNRSGGTANRRDDDERAQRTQGKGDRAQPRSEPEETGRSGSRTGTGTGSGGERSRKSDQE